MVGLIRPVPGAPIVRRDLSKEAWVSTPGFIGVIGFTLARNGPLILRMVLAAMAGSWAGRRLLARQEAMFLLASGWCWRRWRQS